MMGRSMEISNRITINEKVRFGKPVIKGTRVPVDLIIGKLAGGMTYEEATAEYDLSHRTFWPPWTTTLNICRRGDKGRGSTE